jgi:uncharacterized protein (TIGR02265 family)
MGEKLIFSQTFEGIFRALGPRLDPSLSAALRQLGLDTQKPLEPAYPLAVFLEAVRLIGQRLFPELDADGQAHALGREFMDGYSQTMVGRAMVGMMRVLGPRRTLERLSRQFRTGNNFSETTLTQVSPAEFQLWCNQVTIPGWYAGLIERGLELAGAKAPLALLLRLDETGGTFRVTWENS